MQKVKILLMMLLVAGMLAIVQPDYARAGSGAAVNPPAIVFVQDKENQMLINHNFEYDNGISIPWNTKGVDDSFNVDVPQGK